MYSKFFFTVKKQLNKLRLGEIHTPHGAIHTPAFVFCGTRATLKGLFPSQFKNSQVLLSNTYHLHLQPGEDLIQETGGLHKFTGWDGPMMTDSGGYQIFSLGYGSVSCEIKGKRNGKKSILDISEHGATFRSYIDGSMKKLTPETSIDIQRKLGADIVLVLDECTPYNITEEYTYRSMLRSQRWALRSLAQFSKHNDESQALYGIVQGGVYEYLRYESAKFVNDNEFFGVAIGGTLGSTKEEMLQVIKMSTDPLDRSRPVHLLGIGCVSDIFNAVEFGIDTFDCVHPTRIARHGGALIRPELRDENNREHINLLNAKYTHDTSPVDPECECETCRNFSKSYLHHLFKSKEILGMTALTLHNVEFMNNLMQDIRNAISNDTFPELKKRWIND